MEGGGSVVTTKVGARLAKVEALLRERLEDAPGIIVVVPDETWTAEERARFAAGGEGAADMVEKYAGQRPGPRTIVVVLAERPDGPQ